MLSRKKLVQEQRELSQKLTLEDNLGKIEAIAGADEAFTEDEVLSCIVILKYPSLEIIERAFAKEKIEFPYTPGLLSYREMPPILKAYEKLERKPDVIMTDSHGIAHPRGFGLASHLGLSLTKPTIGVAKNKLVGKYKEPQKEGNFTKLTYQGQQVGWVLKSKEGCREIFVSPGNLISLDSSLKIVKNCIKDHKLPEPTRIAHKLVNERKSNH